MYAVWSVSEVKVYGELTMKPRAFADPSTTPCTSTRPTTLRVKKLDKSKEDAAMMTEANAALRGPKRETTHVPCRQQIARISRLTGRHPRAVQNPDTPPIELNTTELPNF